MLSTRVFLVIVAIGLTQAQIAFPEDAEMDKRKANIAGRKPLYSPARCKQYELLFPGDQIDDWICDCAPTAIYHPDTDACHRAYRQGPCANGQMLVLFKDKIIPECIRNPCQRDGFFSIRGICYEFGKNDPCPRKELTYVLGVNTTTLMVDCVQLSVQLQSRFGNEEAPPDYHINEAVKCARGSRLSVQGKCEPIH